MPEIQGPRALLCTCDTVARLAWGGLLMPVCVRAHVSVSGGCGWQRGMCYSRSRAHTFMKRCAAWLRAFSSPSACAVRARRCAAVLRSLISALELLVRDAFVSARVSILHVETDWYVDALICRCMNCLVCRCMT